MHLHKVEMHFVSKMLWYVLLDLGLIFINATTLFSQWKIVASRVTLPFLLYVECNLCFQGFWDHLYRFTGVASTENVLLTMKLLQIILQVLDCSCSMVPVLYHKMKIHEVLHTQQGFFEGNHLTRQRVSKSRHKYCNSHTSNHFQLHTTALRRLAIWLVQSSEASIWRHHRPQIVEYVNPGMCIEEGHCPVDQMREYTESDDIKHIWYDKSSWGDALPIAEDTIWCSNRSIIQILRCFPSSLAMGQDRDIMSRSRSKPNRWQIGSQCNR